MNTGADLIQVNTHSSICLRLGEKRVYIDPFRLEEAPHDADLIMITHEHFDHFSPEDIEKVGRADTAFVLPTSMEQTAADTLKGRSLRFVAPGESGSAAGIDFTAIPAYNLGKPFHPKQQGWVGYLLQAEGQRIYIAGDTDATDEAAAVRCDVALLPIGGKYTMDAVEAAALANTIRPALVIPVHYGSVTGSPEDFERFAAAVDPAIRVCRLL
ncbi:MAG: MBL fold metallo-hydrolase [Oscillospiraceae bacterium]|nr:MBL fold metallo-hydrolase [Oscillospiraceae bacterium]